MAARTIPIDVAAPPSLVIKVGGKKLPNDVAVMELTVMREFGLPGRAAFTLINQEAYPDMDDWEVTSSATYAPGKAIEIELGTMGKTKSVFKGVIAKSRLRIGSAGTEVVLECAEKARKLLTGRRTLTFEDKKDSEAIAAVISQAGLSKSVATTSIKHPRLIQYRETDWAFIRQRAAANGQVVFTAVDGKVTTQTPGKGGSGPTFSAGIDILRLDLEIDASGQLPKVSTTGWDIKKKDTEEAAAKEPDALSALGVPEKKLPAALDAQAITMLSTRPLEKAELKQTAQAALDGNRYAGVHGFVVVDGTTEADLNALITLKGCGKTYSGKVLVSRLRHTVSGGTWVTELGLGLPPDWRAPVGGEVAGAVLGGEGAKGLVNGTVVKIHEDPDKLSRIQVDLPSLDTKLWARMATTYATNGQGSFLLPEVGDEVIVGFVEQDPRFPIILGSLPGPKSPSAYEADKDNSIKAITTKAGLVLEMNDKDKIFTLLTPGKNQVVLSDKDKSLTLKDQNRNTITMDQNGITLKSGKDLKIDAAGKIDVAAKLAIKLSSAGGDVALSGNNVNGDGKIGVKMKGGATAEISAGGQTVVKGAIVQIN